MNSFKFFTFQVNSSKCNICSLYKYRKPKMKTCKQMEFPFTKTELFSQQPIWWSMGSRSDGQNNDKTIFTRSKKEIVSYDSKCHDKSCLLIIIVQSYKIIVMCSYNTLKKFKIQIHLSTFLLSLLSSFIVNNFLKLCDFFFSQKIIYQNIRSLLPITTNTKT